MLLSPTDHCRTKQS